MATYRVYLAKPTTQEPAWDWAQTVVARDEMQAVRDAYSTWAATYLVPPLNQCRYMVNRLSGGDNNERTVKWCETISGQPVLPTQNEFIAFIEDKISKLLASKLDGKFRVVNYPAGFNYGITYGANVYYNKATLKDIDTCLVKNAETNQLTLSGDSFSTLYSQILQSVFFAFSRKDLKTMSDQDNASTAQIASIVEEFINVGGTFSDPLPFGGKLQDIFNQLIATFGSLENLPDSLNALRNAIFRYKEMAAQSYILHNRYQNAMQRLQSAIKNAVTPTAANGGQQINASEYYAGYTPEKLPSANKLIGDLNTADNKISISMAMSGFNAKVTDLHIENTYSVRLPVLSVIDIKLTGKSIYDLSTYTSSESKIAIELIYPGITMVPVIPSQLQADGKKGWYDNMILSEVAAKTGKDETGYQLQGGEYNIDELFGDGKIFSHLKTFVISQTPTVKITMTKVNVDMVESHFKTRNSASISILGIFNFGVKDSTYEVKTVEKNVSTSTITVTFGPNEISGTIPLERQIAYVLGGVPSSPPKDI